MSQKERDRLSLALCIVPRHSACHLTFDCGNLSLHLHGLIFSTHVGSCHGIEFSCHYMGPPVLLLSHYPIASVRMYTGLSLCVYGHEANSYGIFGTGPRLHTIKVPLIKSCPQITHLPSHESAEGPNHAGTHTRTHSCTYSCACNAGISFCLTLSLSVLHTHSSVLVAMHMSPASNTSDLTFPLELHCSWHGLVPYVGFAVSEVRTNFPCFTHSKLLSPCCLSHYWISLWIAWGLFLFHSSVSLFKQATVSVCTLAH